MPNDDAISKATSEAKKTLDEASKKFPSTKPVAQTPVAKAKPAVSRPSISLGDPTTAPGIKVKQDNIKQYNQANPDQPIQSFPKMHDGGEVPKDGVYQLQKGEQVIPARDGSGNPEATSEGRNSEYRKVYVARRQTKGKGGNSPAPKGEEKHDQPKAKKGIAANVNS